MIRTEDLMGRPLSYINVNAMALSCQIGINHETALWWREGGAMCMWCRCVGLCGVEMCGAGFVGLCVVCASVVWRCGTVCGVQVWECVWSAEAYDGV